MGLFEKALGDTALPLAGRPSAKLTLRVQVWGGKLAALRPFRVLFFGEPDSGVRRRDEVAAARARRPGKAIASTLTLSK